MNERIKGLIEALEKRQLNPYYAENGDEACEIILSIIEKERAKKEKGKEDMLISFGGSQTLKQIGIFDKISEYNVLDAYKEKTPKAQYEAKRRALLSDVFLMSANAICENGEIVNIDGNGNRLGAMIDGPDTVIMAIGVNKIVKDKNEAMARIKSIACVKNARRLNRATPCAENGKCESCLIPGNTICCNTVYTRFSVIPNRIKVIIINESLGF
jgi:L-lactate utilization protein LutB